MDTAQITLRAVETRDARKDTGGETDGKRTSERQGSEVSVQWPGSVVEFGSGAHERGVPEEILWSLGTRESDRRTA